MTKRSKLFSSLVAVSVMCLSGPGAAQNVVNHEAEGNLARTHEVGCISPEAVRAQYTPADLYPAFAQCIEKERFADATYLFAVAGAYTAFDRARVTDETAHQAGSVLIMNATQPVAEAKKVAWAAYMQKEFVPGAPDYVRLCANLQALGKPDYEPQYMIRHGMSAFVGNQGKAPLVEGFEAEAQWKKTLTDYINCE